MKKVFVILVLAILISVSFAGGFQIIPYAQTHDAPAPIIQVARAEISVGEEDSQSLKNAFFTGISWSSKNPEDVERYTEMADDLNAEWIKTYDGTNWFTGAWHVFLAKLGWKSSKNGLDTTGNYDTVTGFSGGTRTAVTLLKQGKITANTLCLISRQVISAKELKSLVEKGKVKKIVVYQSDSDIFTSSHFKSQEGIEVSEFSGIKHGDWIDLVTDQIEDENISPELEIINPPESLVTPEVSQRGVGVDDEYKLELKRVHDKLVELGAKEGEIWEGLPHICPEDEEGAIAWSAGLMVRIKQTKKLLEDMCYEEQRRAPSSKTTGLHSDFVKYLQCSADYYRQWLYIENLAEGTDTGEYWEKADAKLYESFEYYNKLVDEINKNIPSELTPITIEPIQEEPTQTKDIRQLEVERVRDIINKIPWTSDDEQMKKAYEQSYYDEQKITPPEGTEDIHNNFLKYLHCKIDAHDYAIKAKAAGSEYIAFRKRYQEVMQQISDLTNAGLGDSKEADELREELIRMSSNPPSPSDEYILYNDKAEQKHKEAQGYWDKIIGGY